MQRLDLVEYIKRKTQVFGTVDEGSLFILKYLNFIFCFYFFEASLFEI